MSTTFFAGSDHAGLSLKLQVLPHLQQRGCTVEDLGAYTEESCDYPEAAQNVCRKVLETGGLGLLICGTGIGMSMAANRFGGIRAALCLNEYHARMARMHNNANVICLGERVVGPGLALAILDAYLDAAFEGGRHQRRIDLIENV